MNVIELGVIAFALALDAAFYSFSYGLVLRQGRRRAALRLALIVAFFQGLMPLVGYTCGIPLREMLSQWAAPILLLVFAGLGLSMIYKTWFGKADAAPLALPFAAVLLVGVLTSIDALAVGGCISLSCLAGIVGIPQLLESCGLIALVTLVMSLLFFYASSLFRRLPTRCLETLAGLMLIGLGWHYYQ